MNKSNKKGVSVILSLVIATGIILVSVLVAYTWGVPIIEDNKKIAEFRETKMRFSELNSKISRIALEGNLSSRKMNINIKNGELIINKERDSFLYTLTVGEGICGPANKFTVSFQETTSLPPGIESKSGKAYEANYTFDKQQRELIIADPNEESKYRYLYLACPEEPDCFEQYVKEELFITKNNSYGVKFSNFNSEEEEATFTSASEQEENIYQICSSGGSVTKYFLYLKYKHPILVGENCGKVDRFGHLDIVSSERCGKSCSLRLVNKDGKIEVTQV